MDIHGNSNHIEDALRKYETKRDQIYKELEIAFVQENVRIRLSSKDGAVHKKVEEPIEFLFYNEKIASSEDDDEEKIFSCEDRSSKEELEDLVENQESSTTAVVNRRSKKNSNSKVSKYLDIEASVSGEYENDSFTDTDELTDESKYIDNDADSNFDLEVFANERDNENDQILKRLTEKFTRKKVKKSESKFDPLICESNDEFPEIMEMSLDRTESTSEESIEVVQKINIPILKEEGKKRFVFQEESLFNNENEILQRISKKEDKKISGFVEKKADKIYGLEEDCKRQEEVEDLASKIVEATSEVVKADTPAN